jgi:hypothetical protein
MSTAITPQASLNADTVTTNSAQATTNGLRFTVARQNNQGVTLKLAVMLGAGFWRLTDREFVVPPTGASRVVDEQIVETPNVGDRYMLVYEGQQGNPLPLAGVTVYWDALTAPASTTGTPATGSVTAASFAAGAVDSAALGVLAVTEAKIATGAVTATKLGAGAVDAIALGTDAVTNAKIADDAVGVKNLALAAFRQIHFTGRNGAGACTATGTKVGDLVLAIATTTGTLAGRAAFESTVTVADQIQQSSATDLSAAQFDLLALARS